MAEGRNGRELVSAWVPAELAAGFKAWARVRDGGASAALRGLIAQALEGAPPAGTPPGVGGGPQVAVRFKAEERRALQEAAAARGTSPANWLRSLALVHLTRKPQWNTAEVDTLRDVAAELRRIGANVNQVARALHVAAARGECPPGQGEAAKTAAELIRVEMRRVVGTMTGNWDYWGLPWAERPAPLPGWEERERARERAERERRRLRPRRRPKRFRDEEERPAGEVKPTEPAREEGPPLGPAGRAALAETMRKFDEDQRARRAEAEAYARQVIAEREQAALRAAEEQGGA